MKKWFNRQLAKLENKIFLHLYDEMSYEQLEDEVWQLRNELEEERDTSDYLRDVIANIER